METISVKLDEGIEERVQRLAATQGRPAQGILRDAIEQYVDREEKREAFRRDTVAAWERYRETGLHVEQDEIEAWVAKLETGDDAPVPQCHG